MSAQSDRLASISTYEGLLGRPLTEVLGDLELFCVKLQKWQQMQNLVSRETVDVVWERHILDSLQLLPLISEHLATNAPANIADIGSGGGFPALPLAIALKGRPVHTHMIESRSRKSAFLKAIRRDFALDATVHTARIEDCDLAEKTAITVITARALAGMPLLFGYVAQLWQPGTRAFLHKGREYGEELRQADSVWRSDVVKHQSKVDPQGVILEISRLERIA